MPDVRKSNCHHCGYLCGVNVVMGNDGDIRSVSPDPERYPYDEKLVRRCRRFGAILDYLDHPDRINYPLKQIGKRGGGNWQQVSWEEALDDIADRIKSMGTDFGPEALATAISAPHAIYWPMHRFMNLWGSPNNIGIGISCWNPRIWVNSLTYGWPVEDELEPGVTRCAMLWGCNPAESDHSRFWKNLNDFTQAGGKLIVVDPRRSRTARLTDHWLGIRPGTDGALALGMLHVIIKEKLYDAGFVENWCSGFDGLTARLDGYSLEEVSRITGVTSSVIAETARLYAASGPAAMITGLGIDMSGANCTQTLRSIAILRAITGNLDSAGASCLNDAPDFISEADLELSHLFPDTQRKKKLGEGLFMLQRYEGYERLNHFTRQHGKKLPARYLTSAHPNLAWQAMLTGEPYPIRGLITYASNPLLCQADTRLVYKALKGLDLLVSLEHFMTPTAMLADYVLPMAGSLEQAMVQTNGGTANIVYGGPAAISPRCERRTGFDFWCRLGKRCGQMEHWPWDNIEAALDEMLSPAGLSWLEFCEAGLYTSENGYRKYLKQGFATPSGKVELHSGILEEMSCDPLPSYTAVEDEDADFPLTLITGARKQPYYSSQHRQVSRLRDRYPDPVVEMSVATAERLGVTEGNWVWIETQQGRILQKLRLVEMRPDTVSLEYGWWYPEQSGRDPVLGGIWVSNANLLTSADVANCDPVLGQWSTRTLRCKVYKKRDEEIRIQLKQAGNSDRAALIELLQENDMEHTEPIEEYRIAMIGQEVAGCIRLEDYIDLLMIRPIAVSRKYRKKSVGRRLIRSVLSAGRTTAAVSRGDAKRFYETLGFLETSWDRLPADQAEECFACSDRETCRPQPMINSK